MLLTANRRLTFSASRRLARTAWSAEENERVYGAGRERRWGSGENYEAHFVFAGDLDASTGMLVNLATAKEALRGVVDGRYDHRFLNTDTKPFDTYVPTPENLAAALLAEAREACSGLPAGVAACHLAESAATGATAYRAGVVERELLLELSAARRTFSPHLSEEENLELFGRAASPAGHGHGYRLRVTLRREVDPGSGLIVAHADACRALGELHRMLDHRNLNLEVPELSGQPMTTECLARFVFRRLARALPVARVRLHETSHLFAEHDGEHTSLGLERSFSAAHCLRNSAWSEDRNRAVYGKCSNPNGHGHRYTVQATVTAALDERSGTVLPLEELADALDRALAPWENRHLDLETGDFTDGPSTGENILLALWPRLDDLLAGRLGRLRVFETQNNRFTLRRG